MSKSLCPQCGETYKHRIQNGYRNAWIGDVDFEVCTTADSEDMYVHTQNLEMHINRVSCSES